VSSYLDTLNDRQKEAVVHGKAPLLILAGAGSGKTRVVTTRIAWLIDEMDFRPDQILAVTFTNKAAREMQDRVGRLVPLAEGQTPMVKTFHSFCAWLLRRNAPLAGLSPHFTIYDDDDALALTKSILPSKIPGTEARSFQHWISRAKDDDKRPEDDLRAVSAHPDFAEVYALYEAKLADTGNTDFGGLIQKTVRLLRDNGAVRTRLQQKFPVVLVDEYQDCNGAQFELLKELYGPNTWLAVVGDDDQSIYRFRGADVGHILGFQDRFEGTTVIRLEENYRSTGNILKVAGQVVAKNQGRLGKTLWTKNPEGDKPKFVLKDDQDMEAAWAADLIQRSPFTETAVLYRTNAQSRAFETTFARKRIRYRIVGTLRFYEREEIKDTLAWLSFLSNPRDEVAFYRIVNKPARGIGKSALEVVAEARGPSGAVGAPSWLDAVGRSLPFAKGKARSGLDAFLTLAGALGRRLESGEALGAVVNAVIEETGLGDYHRQQDEVQSSSKVQNLDELVSAASPFPGGREGLTQFLETIELDTAGLSDDDGDAKVTLITMHNTKGLEFDRVLVTGLEDGLFPRDETAHDKDELEEERRLFYVACTRARKELYLTAVKRRLLHGRFLDRSPSRFLTEIDSKDLDGYAAVAPAANDGWVPGQKVYHEDFGAGIVVKKWYNVGELVLDVRFESGRMGRFLPQYTPLEKLAADD
jgi:DNA helicase-2/ATP-dependent DNA helicase PcrA